MVIQQKIILPEYDRGFHLITDEIFHELKVLPKVGLLHLFIQHTSAALTINENADPDVRLDLNYIFNKLVAEKDPNYTHTIEGIDDMPAHAKACLVGFDISIPITDYRLNLGVWQGIYLCEFRNSGGKRKIVATIMGE